MFFDENEAQKNLSELANNISRTRNQWLQHVLLLCSAVLGLIAGLQPTITGNLPARLALVLTILLLAIGILSGAVALYGNLLGIAILQRRQYLEKALQALRENRPVGGVYGELPKRYAVCEVICYTCLFSSVVSLVAYSVLLLVGSTAC